ncbi:MAG: DUF2188 domain-containing protein [Rhodospirillales bacterium]|nr:DUF2188 domain-containing protein [Rhodospirillales bacterium]
MAAGQTRVHVVRKDGGWQIKREGSGRASGVYSTKAEATEAAKWTLRRSGGELTVQGRDGRIRESMTLGRDSMARIANRSVRSGISIVRALRVKSAGVQSPASSGRRSEPRVLRR